MVNPVPEDARTKQPVKEDRSEQNVDFSDNKIDVTGKEGVYITTGTVTNGSNTSNGGENQQGRYDVNNSKQNVKVTGNTVSIKGSGFRIHTGSFDSSK